MVRRTTRILLGVLGLTALGYAAWQWSGAPTSDVEPTAAAVQLWNLNADQVETVRIVGPRDGNLLVVRRDPASGWRMLAPRIAQADAGRIELALEWLLAPPIRDALEEPGDLASFGLQPPQARLTVIFEDGRSRSLDIGALDPTGSVYYVRLPENPQVAMVSRYGVDDLLGLIEDPPYTPETPTPTGSVAEGEVP